MGRELIKEVKATGRDVGALSAFMGMEEGRGEKKA